MPFAALSASYFAHIGFFNPYLPLWLQDMGLSLLTISVLTAVQATTRLFAPYAWGAISDRTGERVKLLRIGAGRAMPEHGHGGEEITLVLKGAYRDHIGRFAAGDVADLDEEIEHKPVVEGDQDCICLVATERPTRFKTLAARLMQPFVGI